MYATTAVQEDTISEGQRLMSQSRVASVPTSTPTFWDEPTVVARERPQSMKKYPEREKSAKSPLGISPQQKNRTEIYACTYPGCQRKFINQAELSNHVDVLHLTDQDEYENSAFDQHPAAIEEHHISPNIENSSSYPASQRSSSHHGENTIKPIPITEAALQALNSDDESGLTRSMYGLSITGSDGHASSISLISVDTTYSVMEEAEDVALSEVAEPDSPRIQLPVRILLIQWAKCLNDFFAHNKAAYKQGAPYQDTNGQHMSGSILNESPATPSQTSSVASSARASKRKENFDDDGENNGRKPSKIRLPRSQVTPENRPLACPFNKHDSFIFGGDASNPSYHTCSTWNDVKTAYLKQHIIRNHCLPEHHCRRCGKDFKNENNLSSHYRAEPPCELKEIDSQKLTAQTQQELGLRSRNAVSTDRESYWYKVYDTIFGREARDERQVQPYYMGPSHEILESFMHFSERMMPHVIRQSRQKLNLDAEDYNEQNVQLVRTVLQEASQSFLAERRAAQEQSLKPKSSAEEETDDPGERTITVKYEKRSLDDRSANKRAESTSRPWSQSSGDIPQSSQEALRQQLPHSSPYAGNQMYDLTNRTLDATLPQEHVDSTGYSQPADYGFPTFTTETFDNALFLNFASTEDAELYGLDSIYENDMSGYNDHGGIPYRRERKQP